MKVFKMQENNNYSEPTYSRIREKNRINAIRNRFISVIFWSMIYPLIVILIGKLVYSYLFTPEPAAFWQWFYVICTGFFTTIILGFVAKLLRSTYNYVLFGKFQWEKPRS